MPNVNIDELLKKIFGSSKVLLIGAAAAIGISAISTTFFQVQPDERAVVTRFGKYIGTGQPGLNFKLPFGIDREIKLSTRVEQENFGFRSTTAAPPTSPFQQIAAVPRSAPQGDPAEEASMLTGDLKVADVRWSVQYQITDPRKFLFNVQNPIKIIRDISMATMRQVVGDKSVYEVLTVGREQIAQEARELTQRILDAKYDMGVTVVAVNMQSASPPAPVAPSFNDVNAAIQDKDQLINTAEADYNRVIPEARGKAEQELLQAQGFATEVVNRALGDANRLQKMIGEYEKAPEVTKTRLYLETMEGLLTRLRSLTIVDPDLKGVLPVFNGAAGDTRSIAPAVTSPAGAFGTLNHAVVGQVHDGSMK
jgi:membrane protease subunit HflK